MNFLSSTNPSILLIVKAIQLEICQHLVARIWTIKLKSSGRPDKLYTFADCNNIKERKPLENKTAKQ